ncbi:MAG TPA: zinc dependent phospholipase C family protein [Gemmatimonadales bacterium]|nr:zinc dependent phospholipase C family protein [Gemmatimonadales bacterium]
MMAARLLAAFLVVGAVLAAAPHAAHAWTPGTHIYLGESVLANLQLLPAHVASLLRAFPYDFLYGNIAADSSIAKKYAPVGRHCHYWHVGQEIHDLADSEALGAFGWGYLCHLAADTVAHNYFVPRQLVLTSSTASVGHSYWESRVEMHLGDGYSHGARELIRMDHAAADAHLDRIISPTIFSVRTNRRLFRGMVHLVDTPGWQRGMQAARERSRWDLTDADVRDHMSRSLEYMMAVLGEDDAAPRRLDPSGERPLKVAKEIRRRALRTFGRKAPDELEAVAHEHYGLPETTLQYAPHVSRELPWHNGNPEPGSGH